MIDGQQLPTNESKSIKDGDIIQLSLCDYFRWKFTLILNPEGKFKHPKLEEISELNIIVAQQEDMNKAHVDARQELEKQLDERKSERMEFFFIFI